MGRRGNRRCMDSSIPHMLGPPLLAHIPSDSFVVAAISMCLAPSSWWHSCSCSRRSCSQILYACHGGACYATRGGSAGRRNVIRSLHLRLSPEKCPDVLAICCGIAEHCRSCRNLVLRFGITVT